LPLVTEEMLADAQATWQRTAPDSYDVEVAVIGRETATYRVEVRDGEIQTASRDGQPLRQQRTWGTWTVPGMFETIARDVAAVEQARSGKLESGTPQLVLRGQFDPQWGFPRRYQRTELHKFGANQEVLWEVTSWQAGEPGKGEGRKDEGG
jgi:hypothetical protein